MRVDTGALTDRYSHLYLAPMGPEVAGSPLGSIWRCYDTEMSTHIGVLPGIVLDDTHSRSLYCVSVTVRWFLIRMTLQGGISPTYRDWHQS